MTMDGPVNSPTPAEKQKSRLVVIYDSDDATPIFVGRTRQLGLFNREGEPASVLLSAKDMTYWMEQE